MRQIDWSPLVAFLSALVAIVLASLLPDSFFLEKETSAIIIWVILVLVVLKVIRIYRANRQARKLIDQVAKNPDDGKRGES